MRRAARIDANQNQIVAALRRVGATVLITSTLKNAFDILVGYDRKLYIVEIKDGDKPKSSQRLTEGEIKCKTAFESVGVKYNVVTSVDDALRMIGVN